MDVLPLLYYIIITKVTLNIYLFTTLFNDEKPSTLGQ